jgi:hypothetical protein
MPIIELALVKYYGEEFEVKNIQKERVSRPYAHGETETEFINSIAPNQWINNGDERYKELWVKNMTTGRVSAYQLWGTDTWQGWEDDDMDEQWNKLIN